MSRVYYWNGVGYTEIPILDYNHTEYLLKTGGTTHGNLDIQGLRSGRVYGGNYYGVENLARGQALLLGSDNNENQIWLIAGGGGGWIRLRPNNNSGVETTIHSDGVTEIPQEAASDLHYGHAQWRTVQGNRGMMVRNDGGAIYLLSTDYVWDPSNAGWNNHRPLIFDMGSGETHVGNNYGFTVGVQGKIHSRNVADATTTSGGNVHTGPSSTWYMRRSSSAYKNKFSIADLNGGEVPNIPYSRRRSSRINTSDTVPDYHDLLDTATVAFRMDESSDTGIHLGYIVENLSDSASWCVGDDPEDVELSAVVAGNLALLKDLDTQIADLESRITALEAVNSA